MRILKFKTKPWKHQIQALKYLMPREYGALYTMPGTGKTKMMVDLIVNKGYKRILIVAPNKVCTRKTWDKEFEKHSTNYGTLINLAGVSSDKKSALINEIKNNNIIIVINYESIWREPFKSYILKYKLDCVICDESHRIKSPSSKCSRMLTQLGKKVPHRYLVTGTPLAQSPLDIYAQYRFLDQTIFGTNFSNFKYRYANWVKLPHLGFEMLDKSNPYKNLDELHEKMFSCAYYAEIDLDLPPVQDILVDFNMPLDTEEHYKEFQKSGVLELESGIASVQSVLTLVLRLQQICNGYLPTDRGIVEEIDTARRDTFQELLESIPENEPVVVWARYRKDIYNIHLACKEINRKSSELSGKADTMNDWVEGKTSVLVIQISAGAEGLNELVKSKYCIYYSLSHSLMQWQQSRKRQDRPGQTRSVIYYTLQSVMRKGVTIDQKILENLQNDKSIIESIMEDKIL